MAAEKHCELVEVFNELTMLLSRHNRTFFSCSTHQSLLQLVITRVPAVSLSYAYPKVRTLTTFLAAKSPPLSISMTYRPIQLCINKFAQHNALMSQESVTKCAINAHFISVISH